MSYILFASILLGFLFIMSIRVFFHFKNLNRLLTSHFNKIDHRKFIWLRSTINLKTAQLYIYAYNNLNEIELKTYYRMLKSESKSDNVVNTVMDYLVKILIPFMISFIGFMFILPTYIANYSQLSDKSNMSQIKEALKETYINLLSSFSIFLFIFISCFIFFIGLYNAMRRIIRSDIELRIEVIDEILKSKFTDSKLFKEGICSNQVIDEDWQLEYVKFLGVPLVILNNKGEKQYEGILKSHSKQDIVIGEKKYNRERYIIKVK